MHNNFSSYIVAIFTCPRYRARVPTPYNLVGLASLEGLQIKEVATKDAHGVPYKDTSTT